MSHGLIRKKLGRKTFYLYYFISFASSPTLFLLFQLRTFSLLLIFPLLFQSLRTPDPWIRRLGLGVLSHQQSPTGGTRHPPWSSSILPRKGFLRGPNTMQCACHLIFHRRQGQTVRLFLSKPRHTPGTGGGDRAIHPTSAKFSVSTCYKVW